MVRLLLEVDELREEVEALRRQAAEAEQARLAERAAWEAEAAAGG